MDLEQYSKDQLWQMLVATAHSSVMFNTHKAYTRDRVLPEKPDVKAEELAIQINMSLGEALVILDELASERKVAT
jgi:hypothetical protein